MDINTVSTTLKPFSKIGQFDPRTDGLALVEVEFSIVVKDGEGGTTGGKWSVISRPNGETHINCKPESAYSAKVLETGFEQTIKDCCELYMGGHVKIRLLDQAHRSIVYRTYQPTRIELLNAFKQAKVIRKVTLAG